MLTRVMSARVAAGDLRGRPGTSADRSPACGGSSQPVGGRGHVASVSLFITERRTTRARSPGHTPSGLLASLSIAKCRTASVSSPGTEATG